MDELKLNQETVPANETPEEKKRRGARERKQAQRDREKAVRDARAAERAERDSTREDWRNRDEIASRLAEERECRRRLVVSELSPPFKPILPEEGLPISAEEYFPWVQEEMEKYVEEFKNWRFERILHSLSCEPAGRTLLQHVGIEPLAPEYVRFVLNDYESPLPQSPPWPKGVEIAGVRRTDEQLKAYGGEEGIMALAERNLARQRAEKAEARAAYKKRLTEAEAVWLAFLLSPRWPWEQNITTPPIAVEEKTS